MGSGCVSLNKKQAVWMGYWQRAEQTEQSFGNKLEPDGPNWLRIGDLGFLHEGRLYIAGRIKDIIIVRGQNFYPQDIEYLAERAPLPVRVSTPGERYPAAVEATAYYFAAEGLTNIAKHAHASTRA